MKEEDKQRIQEILKIAHKLQWVKPPKDRDYPTMQLSEVEKCMLAMVDDTKLEELKTWGKNRVLTLPPSF
uniref:Uncharacterized protein n=1 Tax=viral metagenome TaxID=1070528 RepID=A0A6M3M967_9ZZZZ